MKPLFISTNIDSNRFVIVQGFGGNLDKTNQFNRQNTEQIFQKLKKKIFQECELELLKS